MSEFWGNEAFADEPVRQNGFEEATPLIVQGHPKLTAFLEGFKQAIGGIVPYELRFVDGWWEVRHYRFVNGEDTGISTYFPDTAFAFKKTSEACRRWGHWRGSMVNGMYVVDGAP